MNKRLAFVLSGGGARGALQVGAMKALLEVGLQPGLLVGTSIGAVNAAYLALHGVNLEGVERLINAWNDASRENLMPSNYLWLTVRALFNRPIERTFHRMQEFFTEHGLTPELRFGDLNTVRLVIVAADLNRGTPVYYGLQPEDKVLEALLASTALPPWIQPLQFQDRLLMDGGVVSNLPIEAAMKGGAREIVAMSLMDFRDAIGEANGFGPFVGKLFNIIEQRQLSLELALAEAKGVRVHRLDLLADEHVALWDFEHAPSLIAKGYEIAQKQLTEGSLHSLLRGDGWLEHLKITLRSRLEKVSG